LLLYFAISTAADDLLPYRIRLSASAVKSECQPPEYVNSEGLRGIRNVVANSQGEIKFVLLPIHGEVRPYTGMVNHWPEGLTLFAGFVVDGKREIKEGLIAQFNPTPFADQGAYWTDSLWRAGERNSLDGKRAEYRFRITVPSSLIGKTVFFTADFKTSNGSLITYGFDCYGNCPEFTVISACSKEDERRVQASRVIYAVAAREFERAFLLTDSLIASGWKDLEAITFARSAANWTENWRRSLQYMDFLFGEYGKTSYYDPIIEDSVARADNFSANRQEILRRMEGQR